MTGSSIRFASACILLLSIGRVCAQEPPETPPPDTGGITEFVPLTALPQTGNGPSLYLGREADTDDYPASFFSMHDKETCTSSLVAPRALLTAAHCIGASRTVAINHEGKRHVGTCRMAPTYDEDKNDSADWAMCLLDEPIEVALYERINTDPSILVRGNSIRLTGFGCRRVNATGYDGIYREGEATIEVLPSDGSHYIITDHGATLCFGDSGGPAFLGLSSDYSKRLLVAVNSATLTKRGKLTGLSYLSSVSTAPAIDFLSKWSSKEKILLCGLSAGAVRCRERK